MSNTLDFASNITGIQHLGLPTKDIAATIDFYSKLGLECIWRKGDEVAFLKLGTLVIETYTVAETAGCNGAIDHVALNVQDVEAAWKLAQELGFETNDTAINFLPFFENGVRFFTVIGPNREKVEFNQIL